MFFFSLGRRLVDSSPTLKWGVRGWALLGEWSIHWNTIPDIFSRVWFGFLAGQGCDAFANLFVTPTLTLNLNTSAYRPHALQVLEACGGTVDTDKLRSANCAQRTSLRELRSANFSSRTALRKFKHMHSIPIALTPPNLTSTPKT